MAAPIILMLRAAVALPHQIPPSEIKGEIILSYKDKVYRYTAPVKRQRNWLVCASIFLKNNIFVLIYFFFKICDNSTGLNLDTSKINNNICQKYCIKSCAPL